MKKLIPFVVLLLTMANNAFADEPCVKTSTITVPVTDSPEDQKQLLPTPCPGENLTVVVQVPVKKEAAHKVTYTPTYITDYKTVVQKGSNLSLRGGVSTGIIFPGHPSSAFTGGFVGEIGYTDSMWRLQLALGAGNAQGSSHNGDGVAINSGIALMGSVAPHLHLGVGVDLFYSSDIASHPMEKANERLVGSSLRAEYEFTGLYHEHYSVGGSIGLGADTVPIPSSRETNAALYGGLSLTLWSGK